MLFACTARTDTASRMLAEPPCRTGTRGTGPRAPSLNRSTAARSPTGERARRRGVQRQRRPLTSAIVSLDLTRRGVREEREGQKKMNRKEGRLSRLFAERHSSPSPASCRPWAAPPRRGRCAAREAGRGNERARVQGVAGRAGHILQRKRTDDRRIVDPQQRTAESGWDVAGPGFGPCGCGARAASAACLSIAGPRAQAGVGRRSWARFLLRAKKNVVHSNFYQFVLIFFRSNYWCFLVCV
jgi:hypothetical protein